MSAINQQGQNTPICIYAVSAPTKVKEEGVSVESKNMNIFTPIILCMPWRVSLDIFDIFHDYDSFACYAAGELYMSMRNKLINEGKEMRGKIIVPIKSSLNFIKATMFPLKINYQNANFSTVVDLNCILIPRF